LALSAFDCGVPGDGVLLWLLSLCLCGVALGSCGEECGDASVEGAWV